jgi:ferric-dicitrate binding protein FerR (iron transport regulator)
MNEIEEFYAKRKIPVNELVKIGVKRFGLKPQMVGRGAEMVYAEIMDGAAIPDVRVAWEVWARAKKLEESVFTRVNAKIEELVAHSDAVELAERKALSEIKRLKLRFYVLFGLLVVALVLPAIVRWLL